MSDYQVVIIGGRPAGSSLAIRLGRHNIKTLVVDKMTFPSLPAGHRARSCIRITSRCSKSWAFRRVTRCTLAAVSTHS